MTGTSLDGLDVALVKIAGTSLEMKAELIRHTAVELPGELRTTLMSLASGEAREPIVYMRAARALGELHAEALEQMFAEAPDTPCDFVTAHGQTIWHAPGNQASQRNESHAGMSWQLFDPWPIVRRLKVPVCYDLRQADLIAGGQGAPLTPLADWVMYREQTDMVLNLGGVCNGSWWGQDGRIEARDIVHCNLLLDGLVQRLFPPNRFDPGGSIAAGCEDCFEPAVCLFDDHLSPLIEQQRSLGREQLSEQWFAGLIKAYHAFPDSASYPDEMLLLAASAYIADKVRWQVSEHTQRVVVAGGGVKNLALLKCLSIAIETVAGSTLTVSDDLGIPCEAREAMGFAVLGALSQDGVPISLPQVTGATEPGVAGVWAYP